jgi:Ran GTPase-activating protein (RanGAP) involved in mRNA processing and transport
MRDSGANVLAHSLSAHSRLQRAVLAHNNICEEDAVALIQSFTNTHLQTVDLSFNSIGDRGAITLAAKPTFVTKLEYLNLSANRISDEGAVAWGQASAPCEDEVLCNTECSACMHAVPWPLGTMLLH